MKAVKIAKFVTIGSVFLIVIFTILWGTTYHIVKKDITQLIKPKLKSFATEKDSIKIDRISISYTDKRVYTATYSYDIAVNMDISFSNNRNKPIYVGLSKLGIFSSNFIAMYQKDTVALSSWNDEDSIPPKGSINTCLSNYYFDGAYYFWEDKFSTKDDYTQDIINVIPDINVYFYGHKILPSKNIKITILNVKDGWISHCIHRIKGDRYWYDITHDPTN